MLRESLGGPGAPAEIPVPQSLLQRLLLSAGPIERRIRHRPRAPSSRLSCLAPFSLDGLEGFLILLGSDAEMVMKPRPRASERARVLVGLRASGRSAPRAQYVRLPRFRGHLPKVDTMSRPIADALTRRPRRQFDDEFKAQAVRLVLDEGKSVAPD